MKQLNADPEWQARQQAGRIRLHGTLVPASQKNLYDKLRRSGISREAALAVVAQAERDRDAE